MIDEVTLLDLMRRLATRRPLFHSEADFQHELAWEARSAGVADAVRLEQPHDTPTGRISVDLVIRRGARRAAIELKYWKRRLTADIDGERFDLKNQAAQDICRYDLWSDVARLERLVDGGVFDGAWAIALTNDAGYWNAGRDGTVDAAFRLHEGRSARGRLAWAEHAGPGTMRNRVEAIDLAREHVVGWRDYSSVGRHQFRWCAVPIRR